jgi:hypothetical protein
MFQEVLCLKEIELGILLLQLVPPKLAAILHQPHAASKRFGWIVREDGRKHQTRRTNGQRL